MAGVTIHVPETRRSIGAPAPNGPDSPPDPADHPRPVFTLVDVEGRARMALINGRLPLHERVAFGEFFFALLSGADDGDLATVKERLRQVLNAETEN